MSSYRIEHVERQGMQSTTHDGRHTHAAPPLGVCLGSCNCTMRFRSNPSIGICCTRRGVCAAAKAPLPEGQCSTVGISIPQLALANEARFGCPLTIIREEPEDPSRIAVGSECAHTNFVHAARGAERLIALHCMANRTRATSRARIASIARPQARKALDVTEPFASCPAQPARSYNRTSPNSY